MPLQAEQQQAASWLANYLAQNWIAMAAVLVSFGAFALSLLVWWAEQRKPFSPAFSLTGRVQITKNPRALGEPALMLELISRNQGARPGLVENVAVILDGPDSRSAFSAFMIRLDQTINVTEELPAPRLAIFGAFEVPREEPVRSTILLRRRGTTFEWRPGPHRGRLFVWTSARDGWIDALEFSFLVEDSDMPVLNSMNENQVGQVTWRSQSKILADTDEQLEALERLVCR